MISASVVRITVIGGLFFFRRMEKSFSDVV